MQGAPDVFDVTVCPLDQGQVPFYGEKGIGIAYDSQVLTELARRLQLAYLGEENLNTEMCFLHSPEVRPEFKLSFTLRDFTDFLNGALLEQEILVGSADLQPETLSIPYPKDSDVFWNLVAAGAVIR